VILKSILQIKNSFIIVLLALSFIAALNFNCSNKSSRDINKQFASLSDTVKYVGMKTCRQCHVEIYDNFIHTGMGSSFDLASLSKSSARFGHQPVYDKYLDYYYFPFWERDSLRIMEYRMEGKDTIHKRIETVSYIVGSGQHTNSHIMNTGGYLNQMPLTFYTQKGTWDLPPGFENGGNSRFSRLIGLECMSCHNSYPVFEIGSENKYSFVDNGIGCERCHGPGEVHVKEKKEGKLVDTRMETDYSIVNPAKLPVDLQLDVCQRCHIQGNAVLNDGKSFFDFRPGMKLSDVMNVYMPVFRGKEHEHIMASHVERMKLSRCFLESVNKVNSKSKNPEDHQNMLTCITCHDPHISVRTTGPEKFNNTCRNCHGETPSSGCSEKNEIIALENFNCIKCHMPKSGATDIPHVTVHDHKIAVPLKTEKINVIREFLGISCINNDNPSARSKGRAFIAYYEKFNFGKETLDSAAKYFPSDTREKLVENFEDLVHIAFLKRDYAGIKNLVAQAGNPLTFLNKKSYDNRNAWTAYRVGEALNVEGEFKSALKYYEKAYMLAPLHIDFANKYATFLLQNQDTENARRIFEKIIMEYPKNPQAWSNLGFLHLLKDKNISKAGEYYKKALALDPDYEQALLNQAGLYLFMKKPVDAEKILRRVLKRNPDNTKARELVNQLSVL